MFSVLLITKLKFRLEQNFSLRCRLKQNGGSKCRVPTKPYTYDIYWLIPHGSSHLKTIVSIVTVFACAITLYNYNHGK